MRPVYQFVLGAIVGIVLGVVGLWLGPFGAVSAAALVVALGVVMQRLAVGGGLLAMGSTWLVLVLNSQRICAGTEDFCGQANFAPWLVGAVAVAIAGAWVTAWASSRNRRTQHI
jgi:hypothetical protein